MKALKKKDLLLILVTLAVAALAMTAFLLTKKEGQVVLVTLDGQEYKRLDLNQDQELTIKTEAGTNLLKISNGYVKMIEADCPDLICVNHPKIHYQNESIVCLPHKLVVEIIKGEDSGVDIIAK